MKSSFKKMWISLTILVLAAAQIHGRGNSEDKLAEYVRLTEEPVTLTYWANNGLGNYGVSNYENVAFYQMLERETGIIIDFRGPASTRSMDVELNKLISSGRLPDIIEYDWRRRYPDGPDAAIENGVIVVLDSLVDSYAPNYRKVLVENPTVDALTRSRSGNLYAFPHLSLNIESRIASRGPIVRTDWFEQLDIDTPKTIDDWERMLEGLKEIGEKELAEGSVTPYIMLQDAQVYGSTTSSIVDYENLIISNIFAGAFGTTFDFFLKDGVIMYGPVLPEFREMLVRLHKWHSDGLFYIASDSSRTRADYLINAGCTVTGFNGYQGRSSIKYQALPYPTDGNANTSHVGPMRFPAYTGYNAAAITTANDYPELSARWLDIGYGERGMIGYTFGIESESFRMEKGVPVLNEEIRANAIEILSGRKSWSGLKIAKYSRAYAAGPFIRHPDFRRQLGLYDVIDVWLSNGTYASPLNYSQLLNTDEDLEFDLIVEPIMKYMLEMFVRFVEGDEPLDMFDDCVQEIEEMGVNRAISLLTKIIPYIEN